MATLEKQREEAVRVALSLVDRVKSGDEAAFPEAEKAMEEVRTLDAQIASAAKAESMFSELAKAVDAAPTSEVAPTLGEHFVKFAKGRLPQVRGVSGASIAAPEWRKNDPATIVTGGHSGAMGPVLTEVDRTIVTGFRRPTVASLFGQGTTTSQAITYFVEGARDGDFAAVAEAGAKPKLSYALPTPVTDGLSKIAGYIELSDEMIEDLDFLVSEINGRLLYDLSIMEETQLLSGNGSAPNLKGLLNRSGVQTEEYANAGDVADAIFRAMTKIANQTGLSADALVINPADYQALRLAKDGNNQYYGGGYFAGQYGQGGVVEQPPVWGLRTVVTPAISAGSPLVGAFTAAATVYRKGGVRVELTNSNADNFVNNLVTIRAEERLALAVRKPAAFVKLAVTEG